MKFYKALKPVKALSFDLDDTLYDNVPVISKAEEHFALMLTRRYGLPQKCEHNSFWKEIKDLALQREPQLRDDVTALRVQGLLDAFALLKQPLEGGRDEAYALIGEFIKIRSEISVPKSSFELLGDLRRKYTVAALSNGNSDLNVSGLASFFDYDFRPEIGGPRSKPCADLFLKYASLLGIEPSQILHVGDEPQTDINGAVKAGCQCAWLYRGYAGKSTDERVLFAIPTLVLDNLLELRGLLL